MNYEISKLTRIPRFTMTMIWIITFVVFTICVRPSNSLEGYYQPPRGSSVWGYFTPPLLYRVPTRTHQTAMDAMVDLTNNLGVAILKEEYNPGGTPKDKSWSLWGLRNKGSRRSQDGSSLEPLQEGSEYRLDYILRESNLGDHSYSKGNFAFSPYGVASVLVVLYEGACGESASQIHRAIGFPFDKDVIRVGFRSIHRHLRSYFSHEGYLSGISLNKEGSPLKPEFKRILKFYGYDVDVNHPVDEDVGLVDLTSQASPSGGAIANSNVTSPSPSGVTEDDSQSMNHANTTEGSDGNKENHKDVTTEAGEMTTEKPESTTKDGNDSGEKEEKPDETGDDLGNDRETEKPDKTPEDDVSAEGSQEKPDEISGVDSAEGGKETPDKTAEDGSDSSGTEDEKPADSETNQNNKNETETSDKTSAENVGGVEGDKENSDVIGEDANNNASDAEKEGVDDTTNAKETGNSDKTSTQDSGATDEDKQNSEDGNDSIEDTADGQDDSKETENSDKVPEDDKTSQEDKENFDSAAEDQSQVPERENEKVCGGKEDCENKTESSTTVTTTAKQKPEEMSITTLPDGLALNKTEPKEEVEDLQVTSSTIKNSDENSENSETGVPTPETESEDNMSENIESPLTSTIDPSQEEEVTKITESGDTEKTTTKPNLDNGMLIPQPDDLSTSSEPSTTEEEGNHESTTPDTSEESTTDAREEESHAEVTTPKPHSRRKRNLSVQEKLRVSNRLRPANKISVWGQMKLAGVEPSRPTRQAFHPKLSAPYRMRNGRTITDYLKWPPASDVSLQLQNGMFDSHVSRNLELYKSLPRIMFLVDGAIDTPVPMMTYSHVFPYAYIPRLHTKALEFPLDDVRYKLLILLPVERRGLRQLIYDLTEFPLREVFTSLQPTRVRAMIPPFMVEGFVILTSSLQKLGIWDVFDPRKSNLSGMSIDPELYVRNVEQSVTVVIRNYVEILDIQTRTMAARNIEHDFEATHPFLYFVLDTATNVALMAGQILDPLNSRIY